MLYFCSSYHLSLVGSEGARATGERVVHTFRTAPHEVIQGTKLIVTASVGIATMEGNVVFDNPEDLVSAADRAVYAANRQGRDRAVMSHCALNNEAGLRVGRATSSK